MKTPLLSELRQHTPEENVALEEVRQLKKWGEQNHNVYKYLGTLTEEVGEVSKAVNDRSDGPSSREEFLAQLEYELTQTAAVAIAFIKAIRRDKGTSEDPLCPCLKCINYRRTR